MKHLFNKRKRNILAWISGGASKCCGTQLTSDFHAGHGIPYSKGGETITQNGQALCTSCNLKKGTKLCSS